MKKGTFILFFFCIITTPIFAQSENTLDDYIRNFRYTEALEYIDGQDATPDLMLKKAICYKALDDYKNAINIFHSLLKDDPQNIKINAELASCYIAISNWEESVRCYHQLTLLDSTNLFFLNQYANILQKTGNYDKALPIYNRMYEQYGLKSAIKGKAECFENMNQSDSAIIYYQKAWENNSYDTYSLANLINLKIKKGDLLEAASISDLYIQNDSTNRIINRLNALAYYSTNLFYDDAAKRFERCYQSGDSSLAVRKGLGMSYYALLKAEEAYPHLTKTYLADTGNVNIIYPLAEICIDLNKYDEAIIYYNKFLEKIIPEPRIITLGYKRLATSYEKNEQYAEALIWYRKLVNMIDYDYVQKMELYYTIGNICDEKTKEYNDAVFYYEGYKNQLTMYLKRKEYELKEKPETTIKEEIEETKSKITSLDQRIAELKELLNQQVNEELANDSSIYSNEFKKSTSKNNVHLIMIDTISEKKAEHN